MHTTQTRLYNTGNTTHHIAHIKHKKKHLKIENLIQHHIHTTQKNTT